MLFHHLGVPRSTAASWIRRGQRPVVSAQVLALDQLALQAEVLARQRRIKFLLAIIRLAFLLVRLSGFRLDSHHVPAGAAKRSILDAVAHATKAIPLAVALRLLCLSAARYHDWNRRQQDCSLDDRSSCPHTSPTQLTANEVSDMREMVVSQDYRHMSLRSLRLEPQTTCQILIEAAANLKNGDGATVIADSGGENVNHEVNDLFGLGQLRRILAQVEVSYSNSPSEALWRSLKHGWLYLHQLDTFAALERLIAFYVEQHNTVVPHSAFAGQTPDEIYFGRGDQVPADLAAARARAREARMKFNRAVL